VAAGVDAVAACLQHLGTRRYGRATAQRLVALAAQSAASGVARPARERILVDQLGQTQAHLGELEAALAELVRQDSGATSLASVPEFGPLTVAVVRAELGDVTRFERSDQAVAYVGLDVTVRQSGKARGRGAADFVSGGGA
jgi:transposase